MATLAKYGDGGQSWQRAACCGSSRGSNRDISQNYKMGRHKPMGGVGGAVSVSVRTYLYPPTHPYSPSLQNNLEINSAIYSKVHT